MLLAIGALNIYKPKGMTAYGRRRASDAALVSHSADVSRSAASPTLAVTGTPRWVGVVGLHAAGLAALFVILHFIGRGGLH